MKKFYIEPSAELFALRSADVISVSPFTAEDSEGDAEYIGYKGLTWTSNN